MTLGCPEAGQGPLCPFCTLALVEHLPVVVEHCSSAPCFPSGQMLPRKSLFHVSGIRDGKGLCGGTDSWLWTLSLL